MSPQDLSPRQQTIDVVVSEWPEAHPKQAFGHRGWVRNGKMFGFLADEGVAVKVPAGPESDELFGRDGVLAFSHSGMEMRAWPVLPVRSEDEVEAALTALQHAYDRAHAT